MDRFREPSGRRKSPPRDGEASSGGLLAMQENGGPVAEGASDRESSVREPAARKRGTHCKGRVCRCAVTGQASKGARISGTAVRQLFAAAGARGSVLRLRNQANA